MAAIRTILCLAEDEARSACFLDGDWQGRWTEVHRGDADVLLRRLGPHLRLSADAPLPETRGLTVGLWLTELDQLQQATADGAPWAWVVFEPSGTAFLDCLRMGRPTLAAAKRMPVGHCLRREDIETVRGRGGIGAELIDSVVGRTLCYPLARGDEITFGFID